MKIDPPFADRLNELFSSQKLGVLATQQDEHPYTSLLAFASTDDLRQIVFATPRSTRKYANLTSNANVSFFIDNRSNKTADFRRAIGVTVLGTVRILSKNKNSRLVKLYLGKHPHLGSFFASPTCAFIGLDVRSYYIVERFQHVTEIHLK